ncbi:MAG TPA: hypothetical protein VMZ06_12440, partial [Candidatus Bathyarchaeia archaeon]|nr:hypothetical protein [Candidatus Bathyarchaeia archaeon]
LTLIEELLLGDGSTFGDKSENTCAVQRWVTHYMDVSTIPTVPEAEPDAGITYRLGPVSRDRETGLYTTYIEKTKRLYQTVALYDSEAAALETGRRRHHLGVKDGDKNDAGDALTLLNLSTIPAGKIRTRRRQRNADCTQDIDEHERSARPGEGGPAAAGGPLVTTTETVKRNQTAIESPGAGAAGTIKDVYNSLNEFGLYDSRVTERVAVAGSGGPAAAGGPLVTTAETVKRNQAAIESPGAGAAGTIKDVSNSLNEFGLYDSRVTERVAVAGSGGPASAGGALISVAETVKRNQAAIESPGVGGDLELTDVSNSLNEFGLWDSKTSTRTAVPYTQSIEFDTLYGTGYAVVGFNQPIGTKQAALAGYSGAAWDVSVGEYQKTDFGRESYSYVVRPRYSETDLVSYSLRKEVKTWTRHWEDQAGNYWGRSYTLTAYRKFCSTLKEVKTRWDQWDDESGVENLKSQGYNPTQSNAGVKMYFVHAKYLQAGPPIRLLEWPAGASAEKPLLDD